MICRKNNEGNLRAAFDGSCHKIRKESAAVEASGLDQRVRDRLVEDLTLVFDGVGLDSEVLNLPFEGVVNIPATEEIAMELATEASEAAFDPSKRFLFTYGASITNKTQQNQESSGAGACITYKQANNDSWHTKHLSLGYCAKGDDEAGLVAISRCLSLVTSDLLHNPNQQRAPEITVFTNYQDALRTIDGARNIGSITWHPQHQHNALHRLHH